MKNNKKLIILVVGVVLLLTGCTKQFKDAAGITGIVLTKLDGTARGGVVVGIKEELGIPLKYIGVGEQIDDLQ